jgi:septum formation protein
MTEIVLASASPRRREILTLLGIPFEVVVSSFDEDSLSHRDPAQRVRELAIGKAMEVSRRKSGRLVLGADTVVHIDGQILEKPTDRAHGKAMLERLSGRVHEVHTGIAIVRDGHVVGSDVACSHVRFRKLAESEIEGYLDTGDHRDKAGSYGIQSSGARLVESIDGCFYNVAGLPVAATLGLLSIGGIS